MEKNIYELFNDASFSEEEFEGIKDGLTEIEKRKIKKGLKRKIYGYSNRKIKVAAASLILTAVMGTFLMKPAFADNIISSIPALDAIYEKLGYYSDFKDLSQYVGMTKEDKGYKFTIDKIIADRDTSLVAMRVYKPGLNKSNESEQEAHYLGHQFMMTAVIQNMEGVMGSGSVDERVLDEDTSIVIVQSNVNPNKEMPKRFEMRVNIHSILDGDVSVAFDLKGSREKIESQTIVKKNLGQVSLGDKGSFKINELKVSPLNTSITYSYKGQEIKDGKDSIYIYDDKGRIYNWFTMISDDKGYTTVKLNRIEKDAEKIYVVPYVREKNPDNSQQGDKTLDFYNKPFGLGVKREFDFEEYGKVNVYNTERNKDSIKIYYTIEGNIPKVFDHSDIPVWLVEKKGDKIVYSDGVSRASIKVYMPDLNDKNNYCIEFTNLNPDKEYYYIFPQQGHYKITEGKAIEVKLNSR